MNVRVKICGITRREDAHKAVDLGASAIGFILAPSPRRISLTLAEKIAATLPAHILRFAVLENPTFEEMIQAIASGALNAIQLHGRETTELMQQAKDYAPGLFILKRFRPGEPLPAADNPCNAILLEPMIQPIRIDQIPARPYPKPLFLAGKVGARNIVPLLQLAQPAGVDLCSAVEACPGIKDHAKMDELFAALRGEST